MMIKCHLPPRGLPLRSRLLNIRRSLRREIAQRLPRWLPVALHWKPTSRRAPPATPRGEAVSHFNTFTSHLHTQLTMYATRVLQRSFTRVRAHTEKIHRSIELSSPLQLPRRAQTDEPMRARAPPTSHEAAVPLPRAFEVPATAPSPGPALIRRRATLELPTPRPAGECAPMPRVPWRGVAPTAATAAPLKVGPPERRWSPVVLAGRQLDGAARPKAHEARTKMTRAEFFSGTPELVWPKAASPRKVESQATAPPEARIAGSDAIGASAVTRTLGVAQSAPGSAARKPTRLSDLEPNFVDRLADDVIRRVERRARIERERRGL
jgi:hypothetical protein